MDIFLNYLFLYIVAYTNVNSIYFNILVTISIWLLVRSCQFLGGCNVFSIFALLSLFPALFSASRKAYRTPCRLDCPSLAILFIGHHSQARLIQ